MIRAARRASQQRRVRGRACRAGGEPDV